MNDGYLYQGRQDHGWFGTGRKPLDEADLSNRVQSAVQYATYRLGKGYLSGRFREEMTPQTQQSLVKLAQDVADQGNRAPEDIASDLFGEYISKEAATALVEAAQHLASGDDTRMPDAGLALQQTHQLIGDKWPRLGGVLSRYTTEAREARSPQNGQKQMADNPHRDITEEEAKTDVPPEASSWEGTKYKLGEHGKGKQADCSWSTWGIFNNLAPVDSFAYPYTQADAFPQAAANGRIPFRKLAPGQAKQVGDVLHFPGHIAIYAGRDAQGEEIMWTASTSKNKYMKQPISNFGKPYDGIFRYQLPVNR